MKTNVTRTGTTGTARAATAAGATAIKHGAHPALAALAVALLLALALPAGTARAQCALQNKAFLPGERIDYELMFNWKFIWIKVGTATLSTDTASYEGQPAYRYLLRSHTSKRADFFFRMRDTLTCYVTRRLEPLYFCKAAEEGKRHTRDEAWFSYGPGDSTHVRQLRTWFSKPQAPQPSSADYAGCVFDMLSILGQARSWDAAGFSVGDKVHFPMTTGRKVEQQTLIYRGKENVKAKDDHTYRCLVFSFVEYDKKGEEEEVITFFVTDDDNHLPIRLDMYLSFGSAKAFFKSVQNNRYPLTSRVK